MQHQPVSSRSGASPWWYGLAAAIVVAAVVTVVALSSGNGTQRILRLSPRALGRVDQGDVDSVVQLERGTYSIVYRSSSLSTRDQVPVARFSVRGGPFGKIRSLPVRNNPPDAEIDLINPGYGSAPTTVDPFAPTAPTTVVPPNPPNPPAPTAPTTAGPSVTGPAPFPTTSYPSNYYALGTGQAEVATFEVTDAGQYRIRGSLTSAPDQAAPPDQNGIVVLYPYRLANQVDAVAGGFFGFLGRLGLSVAIGVLGIGIALAIALVTSSSRGKAKRRVHLATGPGWPQPPPGPWAGLPPGWQPRPPPPRPDPPPRSPLPGRPPGPHEPPMGGGGPRWPPPEPPTRR